MGKSAELGSAKNPVQSFGEALRLLQRDNKSTYREEDTPLTYAQWRLELVLKEEGGHPRCVGYENTFYCDATIVPYVLAVWIAELAARAAEVENDERG